MKLYPNSQLGFTLVEMIVSLALFITVITVSVGALLMLVSANEQLQAEQSVMTNLSFALDSMTREIRTGTHYYCDNANNTNNTIFDDTEDLDDVSGPSNVLDLNETRDCRKGRENKRYQGIAFNEGGGSITGNGGRILYYYNEDEGKIFRRVGDGISLPIVSSGIYITNAEFYVTGSESLLSDSSEKDQAMVTIFIEAKNKNDNDSKIHKIQTTVTQRTLDI